MTDATELTSSRPGGDERISSFVLSLLPVVDFSTLLKPLAGFWREQSQSQLAAVFAFPKSPAPVVVSRSIVGFAAADQPADIAKCALPAIADLAAESLLLALQTAAPQLSQQLGSGPALRHFVLQHKDQPVGAVLLLHRSEETAPTSDLNPLAEWSARLIAQVQQLERIRNSAGSLLPSPAELENAKLSALAEFCAGAGHEINNPVATIAGRVQLLLPGERDPERRQSLLTIGGQAYRIRDMIGDVMLFARPPEPQFAQTDLSQIASEAVEKFQTEAVNRECSLTFSALNPAPVWADPLQLGIAIASLVQNSLEAASPGGKIAVTVTTGVIDTTRDETSHETRITVCDDGPGLSSLDREHLFDPFYSGRQAGRGLGFGLSKCWRIITLHQGRIEVTSIPGCTRFEIILPGS